MSSGETNVPNDFFTGAPLFLNISYDQAKRDFYTHSDTNFRTIRFSYPGDADLNCSTDNGGSWTDCSGNSYVWDYTNYTVNHLFKVQRGSEEYTENFNPSQKFPGLSFAACTHNFNISDSIQNTFAATAVAANDVLCLGDGVVIHNDGNDNAVGFAVGDIKIVANTGDTATIKNDLQTGQNTLDTFGRDNTKYYGLRIEHNVIQGYAVELAGMNSDIWECDIVSTNVNAYGAVKVTSAGPNKIAHSSLSNSSISSGYSLTLNNTNLTLESSSVFGGYAGIYLWHNSASDHTLTLNNSSISSGKTDYAGTNEPGTILFFTNIAALKYIVNVKNSKIESSGGAAIAFKDAPGIAEVNLVNTVIKRKADFNSTSAAVINANSTGTSVITADASSYFCNVSSSATGMFNMLSSDPGGNLTFDVTTMDAHSSNTNIGTCL